MKEICLLINILKIMIIPTVINIMKEKSIIFILAFILELTRALALLDDEVDDEELHNEETINK